MEQETSAKRVKEPNTLDSEGLCLLSLDGGGVRGLSTLYILRGLMDRLNHERKTIPPLKPCEVFDLIGGTSTGGLIAIMLGHLEMDVGECITAYTELMKTVFEKQSSWLPMSWTGNVKARFDTAKLEIAVRNVVTNHGVKETDLFNDGVKRGCRTFVCTIAHETKDIVRLRNYSLPGTSAIPATTCQAALATSAATTFFDPVNIGSRKFADGALGANNPVDEVESEASDIWCSETGDLKPLVKCFVSIGTGNPGKKAIEDNMLKFLSETLVSIATQTENTEKKFISKWRQNFDEKRYFRFNVDQGLQDVGLEEHQEQGAIEAATDGYLDHQAQKFQVRDCIQNLKLKQTVASLLDHMNEYPERHIKNLRTVSRTEALWTLPFVRDQDFVDRGTLLDHIHKKCSAPASRIALVGLGGVGKSQLAIEYAYRIREQSPETWVFWVHASNAARFEQSFREIADQLEIHDRNDPKANIFRLVYNWLRDENKGKWVLILDNVDDASFLLDGQHARQGHPSSMDSIYSQPLLGYLPRSRNGSVLITSRTRGAALELVEDNDMIAIEPMNEAHAVALFEKKLRIKDNGKDIAKLVVALEFMPLAIVQAAAYISQRAPRCSVSQYLEEFQKSDRKKTKLLNHEGGQLRRDWEAKNSIIVSWQICFDHIRQARPSAANLMSLMSFFDRQGIPESLLRNRPKTGDDHVNPEGYGKQNEKDDDEDGASESSEQNEFEEDVLTLRNYSFISVNMDERTFEMHRLVQLATRKWLEVHAQLEKWKQLYIHNLHTEFPTGEHENWEKCKSLFPHAKSAVMQQPDSEDSLRKWASLLYNAAWYAWKKGNVTDAEDMSIKAMKTRKKLFGQGHSETLNSIALVGLGYTLGGRWKEAEELQAQVVKTSKRVLGTKHLDTLKCMGNLASTYIGQGRWKEAEELVSQVVEMAKRLLGVEHPYTLVSMSNQTLTDMHQGRWKEAEEMGLQVMEMEKRVLGMGHPNTLSSMGNLALTYMGQDRWKEAEELGLQVLETRKKVLGTEHPDTLGSMNTLAAMFWCQGRRREALNLMEDCVQLRTRILGVDHPYTISSSVVLTSWRAQKLDACGPAAENTYEQ